MSMRWQWYTVYILTRKVGEDINEQCCHKNNEWCRLSHCVKWLQKKESFNLIICDPTTTKITEYFNVIKIRVINILALQVNDGYLHFQCR